VVACGGFSAVCGSSLATAATMSKVAMPPMKKYGYDEGLAAGCIAAGGTLGILIPPSVILIIFGIMTETDIGLLFIAGILPGLLGVLFYLVAVLVTVTLKPEKGPRGERFSWPQRLHALWGVSGVLSLFTLVIGGIYGGIFTPTEAAGIGASGAFLIALIRRRLSLQSLLETLVESARTTAMIFVILIGAEIFSNYVNIAGLPELLSDWVVSFDLSAIAVIMLIMLVYVVLGTVLESLSMIMLTVPVFYPLVLGLALGDYSDALMDPEMALIWFGIIVVVITEISLITPPVGLNVFVLKSMLEDVKLSTIFRGVTPFWMVDIVRLMTLILLPGLVLWLPNLMAS
jgi:tripartite ATP-independent transporter DctM subunit